jgi:hypothetical protein
MFLLSPIAEQALVDIRTQRPGPGFAGTGRLVRPRSSAGRRELMVSYGGVVELRKKLDGKSPKPAGPIGPAKSWLRLLEIGCVLVKVSAPVFEGLKQAVEVSPSKSAISYRSQQNR